MQPERRSELLSILRQIHTHPEDDFLRETVLANCTSGPITSGMRGRRRWPPRRT